MLTARNRSRSTTKITVAFTDVPWERNRSAKRTWNPAIKQPSGRRMKKLWDTANNYALPPNLGTFSIVEAQDYAATLPDYIKQRGGYLMLYPGPCAIKISVGGINAITGDKRDEHSPNGLQDYVVGGKQPWLDGIVNTEPGVVRQNAFYKAHNYPWFDLYDQHLPKVHHHGAFSKIRSIFTLDSAPLPSYALLDPQSPPSCPRHPRPRQSASRGPCEHPACSECLGESIGSATSKYRCVVCKRNVEKHVRFDKPVATAQCGGGSKSAWWEGEAQI
ncbi:hypothetical protein B0H14DRAFT_3454455 [Mycena olivaceomarginata]|nr:hypothetical protein B0H14DRAFT_3454455 [Mycena olivaceomarginata]